MVRTKADCVPGSYRKGNSAGLGWLQVTRATPLSLRAKNLSRRLEAQSFLLQDTLQVVAARAPRKALGHSSLANASPSPPSRKVESKYAGGNPVCVRPTPTWQKGIGEFFGMSSRHSEKENQIPDEAEAGSSGLEKSKRKSCPLQPDPTEDGGCSDEE